MSLPWSHLPDQRSTNRPVQLAPATAALIERAHPARTGRGVHRLAVTEARTNKHEVDTSDHSRRGPGTVARRVWQYYQRSRGNRITIALALGNTDPDTDPCGCPRRPGAKRRHDGYDPGCCLEQPHGLHLQ